VSRAGVCWTAQFLCIFAGRTKLAGHLLVTEHARCKQAIAARIAAAENLTVSIDGWTDEAKRSVYAFNVNFPDGSTALLGSLDLSDETHSGVALAGSHL